MDAATWVGLITGMRSLAHGGGRITVDIPDDDMYAKIAGRLIELRAGAVRIAIVEDVDE